MRELIQQASSILNHRWVSRIEQLPWQTVLSRSPFWLSLLMVVLIGQSAAEMTWLILAPSTDLKQTGQMQKTNFGNSGSQVRLNSVVNLHLFGEAGKVESVVSDAPIDAPKTNLKLVLRGIFSHSDQSKAMAIIADAAGKEKLYRVGAQVPGGANIHKIYPDRVILMRNGQLEALELPRDDLAGMAVVTRDYTPAPAVKETSVQAPDKLKEMRSLIKTNPQELWKQVRIEPVLSGGKIKGYKLFHQDAQMMKALGIDANDVVTEVNGMPLDDPSALYELLGQLDTMMDIRLTVERNGSTEVIVVHM